MNNRPFEFRVWDKENKCWLIMTEGIGPAKIDTYGQVFYGAILQNNVIIQQFTGLKDKNGNKIFEGDIIEYSGAERNSETKPGIVTYDSDWACFQWEDGSTFNPEIIKYLKVIGNILENPNC